MKRNIATRSLLAAALLGAFGAASAQTTNVPHCASIQSTKPELCIPDWTSRSPSVTGSAVIPGAATSDPTLVVPPASGTSSTTGTLSGGTVSSDTNTTLRTPAASSSTTTLGTPSTSTSTTLEESPSVSASSNSSSRSGGFFKPSDTSSLNGTTGTMPK